MPYCSSDRLSSNRTENSLFSLTKKFFLFLKQTYPKPINTNNLASYLCVSKRRVYDITNILEGLGYLKKRSVNSLEWIGGDFNQFIENDEDGSEDQESGENKENNNLKKHDETKKGKKNHNFEEHESKKNIKIDESIGNHEFEKNKNNILFMDADFHENVVISEDIEGSQEEQLLGIEETRLDQEIDEINTSVQRMLQNEISITNAFVNKNDLLNIESLSDKLVFVVKAPHETFLENKDTPGEYAIEMNVNNDSIDVYFISDDNKRNL